MTSEFEALRLCLRQTLDEASFDLGRRTEYSSGSSTSYANREGEIVRPERLREICAGATWNDLAAQQVRSAQVRISDRLKSDLAESFRHALADCLDPASDWVGHAFPMGSDQGGYSKAWPSGVFTDSEVSSMTQFSTTMAKWAAVLGVDAVTDRLSAWTGGKPLVYRTCVAVGLSLRQTVRPTEGITITPLPLSTAELPSGLPTSNDVRHSSFLGHAVLSVATSATPALFRPVSNIDQHPVRGELIENLDIDLICQALSLECNARIDTGVGWNDYGDLNVLMGSRITWGSRPGLPRPIGWRSSSTGFSEGPTTIRLRQSAIQSPSEDTIKELLDRLKGTDARTRVAVARWKDSMKRHPDPTAGFIDLRIALESLFLPQTPDQQLKFRLATNGAWLVGNDGADRRQVWNVLRDAYDEASKAVHHGKVKPSDDNKQLLANAQEVCRRGILHVLRHGPVRDWNGLILDAPASGPSGS